MWIPAVAKSAKKNCLSNKTENKNATGLTITSK